MNGTAHDRHRSGRHQRRRRVGRSHVRLVTTLLLSLFVAGRLWAGGQSENAYDANEEFIPAIKPVELAAGERLRVVATTNIIGDVLSEVAGETTDVTTLMPAGQNPHGYTPTPSALGSVERAHIVYVNGFGLEEGLLDEIRSTATGPIVPLSAGIEPLAGNDEEHGDDDDHDGGAAQNDEHDDHDHEAVDPHVWMDPNNVIVWVENMVSTLSAADPANAQTYRKNGDRYIDRLQEIDSEIRTRVARIPPERRKLVLDHELFSYFADEYGFQVVGAIVPDTSDSAEPSARDVAQLVELIRREQVPALFVGETASRGLHSLAGAIAEELGGQIKVLPTLTGSLATPGEPGDTYLGFIRYNVNQVVTGLQ